MYLSFFINCLVTLLFSKLDLKPSDALVFYGQCQPAAITRLPVSPASPVVSKKAGAADFNLTASSGAVLSVKNNAFLFEKNSAAKQPIASLSKLIPL